MSENIPSSSMPPTTSPAPGAPPSPGEHQRPGCLTAFIVLAIIGNVLIAGLEFVAALSDEGLPFYFVAGFLNLIAAGLAVGIFFWKRWAVYAYGACIALFMLLNLFGGEIIAAARGIIPIAILIYVVRPVWEHFE